MKISRTHTNTQTVGGFGPARAGDALFHASVPVFERQLANLSHVLTIAEQFTQAAGMDPAEITGARLAPDMFPLNRQIHVVTDTAKGTAYRLAGQDVPKWDDWETTFPDLQTRIAKTRHLLAQFSAADFDGAVGSDISLRFAGRELTLPAWEYVTTLAVPNATFHASIAYGIIRSKGAPLGKFDFLGPLPRAPKQEPIQ